MYNILVLKLLFDILLVSYNNNIVIGIILKDKNK